MASDGSALKKAPVDLNTYQIERKALEIIPVAVARNSTLPFSAGSSTSAKLSPSKSATVGSEPP